MERRVVFDSVPKGKLIGLSHTIFEGLVTYNGLPSPLICDFISRVQPQDNYEQGTTFQIGKIEMVTNTATYIDCPFHRFEDGQNLSEVPLNRFINLQAITIHAKDVTAIDKTFFTDKEIRGKAILVYTGWAKTGTLLNISRSSLPYG